MSRWFRGATKAPAPSMDAASEDQHLQDVELALLKLLNDEIDEANKALKNGNSSYHYVGRGISSFIASTLAAEKELLKDASALLQEAENKSWEDMKRAQRDPGAYRSAIYPPGTEYLLCYSIAQLTNAICHVMSGSVTEAIKGFYKLRKAHLTLHGIIDLESKHFKARLGKEPGFAAAQANSAYLSRQNTRRSHRSSIPSPAPTEKDDPFDHERSLNQIITNPDGNESAIANGDLPHYEANKLKSFITRTQSRLLDVEPSSVGIHTHTDIFIHSGTRLCYGILMVVFSMIENPMFTKILYIVGFQGDRDRGTRYLWQSARFSNFNSAIAGISLLGYYNGLVGSSDVLPTDPAGDDDLAGYPQERCENLLADMRSRYPDSKLWKLEEARMCAHKRELNEAIKILLDNAGSNMAQIASIISFEQGLNTMFSHDYELCAKSWIQCAELSSWSPTQYAFMTGIAYLELYRDAREHDIEAAKTYKQKATDYIRKAPPLAGRQKVMNKELPFDTYVKRKVLKWETRAKAWGVDMIDATGVSPITEMIFLWNGVKKQGTAQLQKSLDALQWRRVTCPEKFEKDLDEQAIHAVISGSILRNKKDYEKARHILQNGVLDHQRQEFKGPQADDWSLPFAHYEMAALEWAEKDLEGMDSTAHVNACQRWLEKAQKWPEQYIMDTRLSVKIMTSLVTVKRHRRVVAV